MTNHVQNLCNKIEGSIYSPLYKTFTLIEDIPADIIQLSFDPTEDMIYINHQEESSIEYCQPEEVLFNNIQKENLEAAVNRLTQRGVYAALYFKVLPQESFDEDYKAELIFSHGTYGLHNITFMPLDEEFIFANILKISRPSFIHDVDHSDLASLMLHSPENSYSIVSENGDIFNAGSIVVIYSVLGDLFLEIEKDAFYLEFESTKEDALAIMEENNVDPGLSKTILNIIQFNIKRLKDVDSFYNRTVESFVDSFFTEIASQKIPLAIELH